MSYKKTYLHPEVLRRGSHTLVYVTVDRDVADRRKNQYMLGTYYERISFKQLSRLRNQKHYKGEGREYNGCHKMAISKELYEAFIKEAKKNHKRCKDNEVYRKLFIQGS